MYNGTKDPLKQLENFKGWMDLNTYTNVVRCCAFQLVLIDKVRVWYHTLKSSTIYSFIQFGRHFLSYFSAKRRRKKNLAHLLALHQGNEEKTSLVECLYSVAITALHQSLCQGDLWRDMAKYFLTIHSEAIQQINSYINMDEMLSNKRTKSLLRKSW